MSDFLLELLSEEIPARMQAGARAELERLFRREMEAAGVSVGDLTIWSTPRRLALIARDLPEATEASKTEIKGPRVGAPDQAIDGFLRRYQKTRDNLTDRNGIYFLEDLVAGRPMMRVLQEAIPTIIRDFGWPKSQRWGAASISTESLRWVRPLQGIVAILGDDLVECEVGGISSGYATHGHRFHCAGEITIGSAADYAEKLRACHVIVDHEERQDRVREGAKQAAADAGLTLVEDEGLVIENAGLTEWPVPLLGRFDESYLDVPPEVIQLTARVNQKYFVCEDAAGNLANAFICTANITADDPAVVVDGNRKVLAARLSDARFFWELDQKTTLADHAKKLERITFHEKLGTVADKVERVAKLARWLVEEGIVTSPRHSREGGNPDNRFGANNDSQMDPRLRGGDEGGFSVSEMADLAEQAARLCKADLVTEMVGEFPELQGLMGGYYAEKEGLPQEVADAIRDHYKPVGQGDEVPTAPVTVAVSLADKLDNIAAFFAIDEKPTGSKDPFALRRASIGVLALIVQNSVRGSLTSMLRASVSGLGDSRGDDLTIEGAIGADESDPTVQKVRRKQRLYDAFKEEFPNALDPEWSPPTLPEDYFSALSSVSIASSTKGLLEFFADRLKVQQKEAGVRHDLIDAVFALGGEDDLVRLLARVHALQSFMATEDGANLLAGYKRAANILKKEEWVSAELSYTPEPAEKALMDALDTAEPQAEQAVVAEDFAAAMSALASLRAPIDHFFDEVTVNADEEMKRANRLDLLARFRAAVHKVADFSRIEG